MKRNIVLLIAAVLFIGMGCAGGADQAGSPDGNFVTGGAESPGGSGPFFVPGGSDEADDEGEPAPPPRAPGGTNQTNDDDTPKIECFSNDLPEGAVDQPYESVVLAATGGSGEFQYSLKSGELPAGLELSEDGTIEGTPTEAAENHARVTVTDQVTEKTKSCSVNITVKGDLGLAVDTIYPQGVDKMNNSWDIVYKATASGDFDRLSWSWGTGAQLDNVCASSTEPNTDDLNFRAICTSSLPTGDVVYVWLKEDKKDESTLQFTLGVTNDYANATPAPHQFTFTYSPPPECGNGVVDAELGEMCDGTAGLEPGFICDSECQLTMSPAQVKSIRVHIWTGKTGNDTDTDCDVSIQFCKDETGSAGTCTDFIALAQNGFSEREDREFTPSPPAGMTNEHKYFRIQLDGECHGDPNNYTDSWLFQSVDLEINYEQSNTSNISLPAYKYRLPCVHTWMDRGDVIPFSPNDTAVCAMMTTGESGTDDTVYLVLKNFSTDAIGSIVNTTLGESGPYFTTLPDYLNSSTQHLALTMHWSEPDDADDFEEDDVNSYGRHLYNVTPYTEAPTFYIQKLPDGTGPDSGDYGGWNLNRVEIIVFQPGKYLNPPAEGESPSVVYSGDFSYNNLPIEDEHSLYSGDRTLSIAADPENAVTMDIGAHTDDV